MYAGITTNAVAIGKKLDAVTDKASHQGGGSLQAA